MTNRISERVYDDEKVSQPSSTDPSHNSHFHLSEQYLEHADTPPLVVATHPSVEWNLAASTSDITEIVNYQLTVLHVSRTDQFARKCISGFSIGRKNLFGKRGTLDSSQSISLSHSSFYQEVSSERWVSPAIGRRLQAKFTEEDTTFSDMRSCVSGIRILVRKLVLRCFSWLRLLPRH